MQRDPIKLFSDWLLGEKLANASTLEQIESEVRAEMQVAVDFAIAAPYPTPEEAEQDVYA